MRVNVFISSNKFSFCCIDSSGWLNAITLSTIKTPTNAAKTVSMNLTNRSLAFSLKSLVMYQVDSIMNPIASKTAL